MAPANREQRETTVVPPHPVLDQYYSRPDERQGFVADLFDGCARYYNRVGTMLDLGSGRWYRRDALRRAGLRKGMRLLDVAAGTGLMTRGGVDIVGKSNVVGVDPSQGMLGEAKKAVTAPLVRGRAEALPFRGDRFDMLSMGFALRHVPDLGIAFREYFRVLKPGGRIILLETPRPETRFARWFVKTHFQRVLPWMARITFRNEPAQLLMKFYWDTIDQCVPPETILDVLRKTGFADVKLQRTYVLINEYTATKPIR
jgi:demethylmenaquinone methyltransferase / 2-methoxy-6-polyprenyl-1,4-benzoquinol methylase